ncbi:MAG: L,D-transpeptidase family protein [Hyphomicrobiaceae bacterium]|nr:L,D-transpeptidase family protein [Hyphomicrobiaceae bacterium]
MHAFSAMFGGAASLLLASQVMAAGADGTQQVPPQTTGSIERPALPASTPPPVPREVSSPLAVHVAARIEALAGAAPPAAAPKHDPRSDLEALRSHYAARANEPLWMALDGPTDLGRALASALSDAPSHGLDPALLAIPALDANALANPEAIGRADVDLSLAALAYARQARGGRIPDPASMLNSNLDRKPQLHEPVEVLDRLSTAVDIGAALSALNPVHPQYAALRRAYLAETGGDGRGKLTAAAKRLRANMEFWRWMWDDLGDLHVFNNIPEFVQRVYRDGEVIRTERIVVGELANPSSVFSRQLQSVVLRPRWRVPESIMVHEVWPSLLRGGGMMRKYGLEITTKSGEPRDWRTIDWTIDDIRNYHVWQPPGRNSALGFVKFSFPSQHTIFMHDTPDKWMFNARQRTLSHGCLRLRNPMQLTEIVLAYDKGWDRAKIEDLIARGPLDNDIRIEKRLPIHLAYFTAWADPAGGISYFADIYGHEKRVTQALDGDWKKIAKGRDHLAKVQPRFDPRSVASEPAQSRRQSDPSVGDIIGNIFNLGL